MTARKKPEDKVVRPKGNGAGKGDGWGGPAKGAGSKSPAQPSFAQGNTLHAANPRNGHPGTQTERAAELRDHLYHLALNAQREETQVTAARAYLDRVEGTPIQRVVNHNADDIAALSDDALAARQEDLARALREGPGGAASPARPARSDRVVN